MALALAFSIHNKSNPHIIELCLCHCSMAGSIEDAKPEISPQDNSKPHFILFSFCNSSMAGSIKDAQLEISLQEEPLGDRVFFLFLRQYHTGRSSNPSKQYTQPMPQEQQFQLSLKSSKTTLFPILDNKKPTKKQLLPGNYTSHL